MTRAEPNAWTIRRATEADSKRISDFQRSLNRPQRSESIASEYFVAEVDGDIIGCAAVRAREGTGYLYGLVVSKQWRRHGVGHGLTDCRLDWLRKNKAVKAYVLVMFWNIRFFKRHGFELADRKLKPNLAVLHQDFADRWSSHSVLLMIDLKQISRSLSLLTV